MFDLRYHVASLAAVFLALIVGIVVGVGISGKGFVSDSERELLNAQIADLQGRLDVATRRGADLARAQRAAQTFVRDAYPALMDDRLRGKRIVLLFVGHVDGQARSLVERALTDAGAAGVARLRALKLPIDPAALSKALAKRPALRELASERRLGDLGRRLGQELVLGGESVLWNALAAQLIEERSGDDRPPAEGVVVVRTVQPQRGASARFLAGFYVGLNSGDAPAVGVETTRAAVSAVETYAKAHLSSVDDVDTEVGRLALVLLLGGAPEGDYGVKRTAKDGVLPPIASLHPPAETGG